MKKDRTRKVLWGLIFILLSMPSIQYHFNPFKLKKLIGYYEPAKDVSFTTHDWWEGTYQEGKGKYINDNMGFRPDLVRINNEVDLSFFNLIHSNATLGKENYVYYDGYINSYLGKNFLGHEHIKEVATKMKYLNDAFRKEGKTFVMVIAASKADVFPEYLPDRPGDIKQPLTNTEVYKHYCDSLGVPCINFNDMFLELKKTKKRLFTKQGIHWSRYGAMFAVDSLYKFIEKDRHINLPDFKLSYIQTDEPRGNDDDVGLSLNLIFPIRDTYTYPVISFTNDTIKNKPSAVYIGDSFMWLLLDDSLAHMHEHFDFWHYFKDVYHDNVYVAGEIQNYDWKSELDKKDCVIILYTSANMDQVVNFVNAAYDYYKEKEKKGSNLSSSKNTSLKKE